YLPRRHHPRSRRLARRPNDGVAQGDDRRIPALSDQPGHHGPVCASGRRPAAAAARRVRAGLLRALRLVPQVRGGVCTHGRGLRYPWDQMMRLRRRPRRQKRKTVGGGHEAMSQQAPLGAAPTGTNLAKVSKLFPGWTPEEVDLARRTVAPDATEHELELFLRLCMTYGLDPFRKELVLEKRRRRRADGSGYDIVPVFITTRDAYLKVAQRDPAYAGLQSGVVREGDDFEFDVEACRISHRLGATRGKIMGAWAVAKHAQRRPFLAYGGFSGYNNPPRATCQK